MSETKFTPGPWEASRWRVCTHIKVGGPPIKVICDTANNAATRNDENAANARLIAAAPALYAALEFVGGWLASFSMPPTSTIAEKEEALARIDAALALAAPQQAVGDACDASEE